MRALSYLISLPLGLSHKLAKDLLRFGAVTVQSKARVRHDTELEPGDVFHSLMKSFFLPPVPHAIRIRVVMRCGAAPTLFPRNKSSFFLFVEPDPKRNVAKGRSRSQQLY